MLTPRPVSLALAAGAFLALVVAALAPVIGLPYTPWISIVLLLVGGCYLRLAWRFRLPNRQGRRDTRLVGELRQPSLAKIRHRFFRVSAVVLPSFALLGGVVGYFSSGYAAAAGLAIAFATLLSIALTVLYRLTIAGRPGRTAGE